MENGLRLLTGAPVFSYFLNQNVNLSTVFQLLQAADRADFIMSTSTDSGENKCGIVGGHAYTVLSAFTMIASNQTTYNAVLIRNPWGKENYYNQSWRSNDAAWTNALVA